MSKHPKVRLGGRWAAGAMLVLTSCGTPGAVSAGDEDTSSGGDHSSGRRALSGENAPPTCAEITRFADQLVDVGIVYDYQPTSSPAALARQSDAVFAGTLTGGFDHATVNAVSSERGESYVAYEVEVSEVIVPFGDIEPGDEQLMAVAYSRAINDPGNHAPEDYEAAIAEGAPVVIFAYDITPYYDGVPGGLSAHIEAFATGCEGEPPIGWTGSVGEWADLRSLDDLVAAARE